VGSARRRGIIAHVLLLEGHAMASDDALPPPSECANSPSPAAPTELLAGRIIGKTVIAYEAAGQLGRAETWRRKWLAHVKDTAGADSLPCAGELAALGMNLLQQKN
jgi:hypothetical protein